MSKFIDALNSINSQVWAFLMLCAGIFAVWLFHRAGIEIGIAAGIIGAATNMFNQLFKSSAPGSQHLEVDSSATPPATTLAVPLIQPGGPAQTKK